MGCRTNVNGLFYGMYFAIKEGNGLVCSLIICKFVWQLILFIYNNE